MDQDKKLKRFIIYLKNIIFFKTIMYLLCIGSLLWLLQVFEVDLIQSVEWLNKAERSLYNANTKLTAVSDSDAKILEVSQLYNDILMISNKQRCDVRINLIKNLRALATKYDLADPINIKMSQSFLKNDDQSIANRIKVKKYDMLVQFAAPDFNTALNLIREAYSLMPNYSMTLFLEAREQEILTPAVIDKLSPDRYPDLINTEFTIRIREVRVQEH